MEEVNLNEVPSDVRKIAQDQQDFLRKRLGKEAIYFRALHRAIDAAVARHKVVQQLQGTNCTSLAEGLAWVAEQMQEHHEFSTEVAITGTHLAVHDQGAGFDTAVLKTQRGSAFRLPRIAERLKLVGGTLQITSHLGQGTHARVFLPPSAPLVSSGVATALT